MTLKETYLDLKAILLDGSIVVIEMQVAQVAAFSKRVTYNLSKAYAKQLSKGEYYPRLNPAIAVTITDFILFKDEEDIISQFIFYNPKRKFEYPDKELQLIFVELPKFQKDLSEIESLVDKWIYFLKEAASLEEIPSQLGSVSEIERALNIANQAGMTVEELEVVERRGITLQDEKGRLAYAEEKGRTQGIEVGRLNQTIALVMVLVNQRFGEVSEEIRSQIEGLSLQDLETLVKEFLNFKVLADLQGWLESVSPD